MENKIINMENEFRIKQLLTEIERLQNENTKLLIILKEAGIEESGLDKIDDEEVICVQQIKLLKEKSDEEELSIEDVKKLDILHRNLKIARGENTRVNQKSKTNNASTKDLISIVKGK
jgi:hypothetical protein